MIKLLIISESFAPKNAVASIRFTKVVKYLAATGEYEISVITTKPPCGEHKDELLARDIASVKDHLRVVYVQNQRLGKRVHKAPAVSTRPAQATFYVPGEKLSLKKRLKARYLYHYQISFAKKSFKAADALLKETSFDTLITTYGGIGTILAGLRIKRKYPDIKWIVDYRDVISAKTPYLIERQRRVCEKAEALCHAITGASKDCIGSGKYLEKFTEITNSADADDIDNTLGLYDTDTLNICFSGSFYPGMDDAEPLFKMLSELIEEKSIAKSSVRLILIGKNPGELIRTASQYDLEEILDVRGFVPRIESIEGQKKSDLLLMFTHNTKDTGSFMHAKLMEYLMMDKKLLCMVSGDCPGSFNGRLIRENGLGECYEKAQDDQDYERVKAFIKDCCSEKHSRGYIDYVTPEGIKDRFSSHAMAMKFDRLIR